MNIKVLAVGVAAAFTFVWAGPGLADMTMEERLERLEQRLRHLESRVQDQDETIRQKDRAIAELKRQQDELAPRWERVEERLEEGGTEDGWFQSVEMAGLVEVEAGWADPYAGDDESDIVLATMELGIGAVINDWTRADMLFLHEEDETDLEVDIATVTIAAPDGPWALTGGQLYLPFGVFDSHMVSDPLTLELGETRESAVMLGAAAKHFSAGVYLFNGENDPGGDEDIDNWGAVVGYATEAGGVGLAANIGFINDLGDSDALQGAIDANLADIAAADPGRAAGLDGRRDDVHGWFTSAVLRSGRFTLIGEYLAAIDHFEADELMEGSGRLKPEAWNVEAGAAFALGGRDANFAVGLQGTDEAVSLELPRRRYLATLSVGVMENTLLSFEWAHDEDYGRSDGGTGDEADTVTIQVAVEF